MLTRMGTPHLLVASSCLVLCGLVIGLVGCTLGCISGILSAVFLNPVCDYFGWELFPRNMFDIESVPYRLEPLWIVQVAVAALILTLAMAWLPARRAARLDPVRALAYE